MTRSEQSLFRFLAAELAPTPGRGRATAQIVVACVVATVLGLGFHVPEVHWAIVTIFTVSQSDVGASLVKALQRVIGTIVGGAAGILAVTLFADQPWLRVPLLGAIAALGTFLSRTTTAPYVGLLGALTGLMIGTVAHGPDPSIVLAIGFWRILLISAGVVIGVGVQLLLWPVDPEETLRAVLRARFAVVAGIVRRLLAGASTPDDPLRRALDHDHLLRQMDLLKSAEARYPSLRHHHLEQLAVIASAERLLTSALALQRVAPRPEELGDAARRRLERVASECDRLAAAVLRPGGAVPPEAAERPSDEVVAAAGGTALLGSLVEMERALGQAAGALGCSAGTTPVDRRPSPLDVPTAPGFFTPAFSAHNTADLTFALKAGIASTICLLLVNGLAWPGLETAVWTSVIVAQSSVGAIVQKSLLRLAGAALGGLLAAASLVLVMPNAETMASMVVMIAAGSAVAAWLTMGSARLAYAGIQTGLAFGLCVVDAFGPVVQLSVPRDRVLGIFLGIVVTGLVFAISGHRLARDGLRATLVRALRALAALARVGIGTADLTPAIGPSRGYRWSVYTALSETLQLNDEAGFEAGARRPEVAALRAGVLDAINDTLGAMLALLAVVRHRLAVELQPPADGRERLHALAAGIVATFEGLADRLDGRPVVHPPDLRALLARVEATPIAASAGVHVGARIALYRALVDSLDPLERDVTVLAAIPRAT